MPLSHDAAGPAHCGCANVMSVTMKNQSPSKLQLCILRAALRSRKRHCMVFKKQALRGRCLCALRAQLCGPKRWGDARGNVWEDVRKEDVSSVPQDCANVVRCFETFVRSTGVRTQLSHDTFSWRVNYFLLPVALTTPRMPCPDFSRLPQRKSVM
jgi:hypothetical protein